MSGCSQQRSMAVRVLRTVNCQGKPVKTTQFWLHSHPPVSPRSIHASWCPFYVQSGKSPPWDWNLLRFLLWLGRSSAISRWQLGTQSMGEENRERNYSYFTKTHHGECRSGRWDQHKYLSLRYIPCSTSQSLRWFSLLSWGSSARFQSTKVPVHQRWNMKTFSLKAIANWLPWESLLLWLSESRTGKWWVFISESLRLVSSWIDRKSVV